MKHLRCGSVVTSDVCEVCEQEEALVALVTRWRRWSFAILLAWLSATVGTIALGGPGALCAITGLGAGVALARWGWEVSAERDEVRKRVRDIERAFGDPGGAVSLPSRHPSAPKRDPADVVKWPTYSDWRRGA